MKKYLPEGPFFVVGVLGLVYAGYETVVSAGSTFIPFLLFTALAVWMFLRLKAKP